jgi:membrane protein DedA with SNARE-associated domain
MHHHLAALISDHGYWVTFVGALLEGETILVLAGLAAERGYLHLPALIALGAVGGFAGDQIYFFIGRRAGSRLLARYPRFQPRARRVAAMIERYPELSVIGVRFLYGLRTVGPAAIGMSGIAWWHFALLNAIGATVWSVCWIGAGYLAGDAIEMLLGSLRHAERLLFAIAGGIAVVVSIYLRWRRRRGAEREPRDQ